MSRRLARVSEWAIIPLVLCAHVGLLAWNAKRQSPTMDEPAHLVAGLSYWTTGRFDLYNVNPPLPRLVGALPVLFMKPHLDALHRAKLPTGERRPEFALGRTFIDENVPRVFAMFTPARCALIVFSLLGALVCYWWARRLSGPAAGHLALMLWCFFPEVLAHGSLLTNDVPAASTGILAAFGFWNWLGRPTMKRAGLAGFTLGVALLTKTTWLVLLVLWPLLWLLVMVLQRRSDDSRDRLRELGQLALALAIAVGVVNAGYLFQGSFQRLGDYEFMSESLSGISHASLTDWRPGNRFHDTPLGAIPVPLPAAMVRGVDAQKFDFENYRPAWLLGRSYQPPPSYFYLYAALVKWPLGFWLLLWFGGISRVARTPTDRLTLLIPPAAVFVLASATATPGYFRYVLPAVPFLIVWCAQIMDVRHLPSCRQRLPVLVTAGWLIASSLSVYPHSLSYFNEFAGGPQNGHVHLNDCNVEWGQDLFELKEWVDRHPEARPLYVLCYGPLNPRLVGIDAPLPFEGGLDLSDSPPRTIKPGFYAISVVALSGNVMQLSDAQGRRFYRAYPECEPLRKMEPIAQAGSSIYIFHIDDN